MTTPPTPYSILQGDAREELGKLDSGSVALSVTSPPYFIGKSYDISRSTADFVKLHRDILPDVVRVTKAGGSICWQVGYHVTNNTTIPLDFLVHEVMREFPELTLRNRIIWRFGHGLHASKRFSGRHETILWYTKGDAYDFDLDAVRTPQKYPGKRHFKGPNRGELSGNPKGKNPSDIWDVEFDVWDIPNVKGRHVEKTEHPCQFPVAIPLRLIRALTSPGELILDPFVGSGSTGVAAVLSGRRFVGFDTDQAFVEIARERCEGAVRGDPKARPDLPVMIPNPKSRVATRPEHFATADQALAINE